MKNILYIGIILSAVTACFAQVIDKVGDQYAVGAYLTTREEQEAIIAQADREIANAQAYCQRTYIQPQQDAKAKAQATISEMDAIDAQVLAESQPPHSDNWSDTSLIK